jgi:hypothetical protein
MIFLTMLTAKIASGEILDTQEVADLYKKHRRTVDAWIRGKNPPPSFKKGNVRLFCKSELLGWRKP